MHTCDKCDLDDEHHTAWGFWDSQGSKGASGVPGGTMQATDQDMPQRTEVPTLLGRRAGGSGGRVGLKKWDVLLLFWEMLGKSWNISLVNLVSSILFELETYGFPYNVPMEVWLVDVIRFYDGFQMGADRPAVFLPFYMNLAGLPQK